MCANCYPWIDDLPEFVLMMLLQLVTSSLLSCAVHVVLLKGVHPPLSMPSSRKDCLPRAMLSSPILNGVSRYLFFPFSHFDAKYSPWE